MPVQAQLDIGIPGQPLPLEGDAESKGAGFVSAATGAFGSSLGVTAIERSMANGAFVEDTARVSHDDAVAKLKAQNYDTSAIPADGVTPAVLDMMMRRQSEMRINESVVQRANLGGVGRFAASLIGGLPDPVNVALLPFAPELKFGEIGLAGRAGVGAGLGVTYTGGTLYGSQVIGHSLGDPDANTMDNLRTIILGGFVGGGLHMGFGGKMPEMKTGGPELRDQIFGSILKAEGGTTYDTGGLTRFGISEKAHPNVDIANLTQADALKIIKTDYWDKIGASDLPANIQYTAVDAAFNQGVANAKIWLKESGGDPVKFNALREAQYRRLAAQNPVKYGKYLDGWLNRLANLKKFTPLAPEQMPRIASVDQMGANVDELPPPVREAAAQTAVTQFLKDDEVNVDQVINKGLEEQWGVKPTTDEDPTAGEGRRLQGDDVDLAKAIPEPGRALVDKDSEARVQAVQEAAAAQPKATEGTEGPLTAEAKSAMTEAVSDAKNFLPTIGEETGAEFENDMARHDEIIADHNSFADSVEAAVRCAANLGLD